MSKVNKSTELWGNNNVIVGTAHRLYYPDGQKKPAINPDGKRYIEFRSGDDVWRMNITKQQAKRIALGLWELTKVD